MHDIEPYFGWEKYYVAHDDVNSPFNDAVYNLVEYTNNIYGYYIHPLWDFLGSETLYIKILYIDYSRNFAIIEMFGEWNDALHNDIMHFKRNALDVLINHGIKHFVLIGEHVFNFHASDECYYEEWFEEVEEGWIAAINFRDFVTYEWKKYRLDYYINFGGNLEIENWRTMNPVQVFDMVNAMVTRRIG